MKKTALLFLWLIFTATINAQITIATDGSGDYNCNGINDEIEINQAITQAYNQGGGIVHLKNGLYIIDDPIKMKSNITFEGESDENTIIKLVDEADWGYGPDSNSSIYYGAEPLFMSDGSFTGIPYWDHTIGRIENVVLQNFKIDGNRDNQHYVNSSGNTINIEAGNSSYNAIDFGYSSDPNVSLNLVFSHVNIVNTLSDAIIVLNADTVNVNNCKTANIGHSAAYLLRVQNVIVELNKYDIYANSGIRVDVGNHIIIRNNHLFSTDKIGNFGIQISHRYTTDIMNDVLIENNLIEDIPYAGIALYTDNPAITNGVIIRNNLIYRCGLPSVANESGGINIFNYNNTIIENNTIFNNSGGGIVFGVNPYYATSDLTGNNTAYIKNNIITNSIGLNIDSYGIYVHPNDNTNLVLENNNVWGNQTADYFNCSAGSNSISLDPLFIAGDVISDKWDSPYPILDLHLQQTSPCIDSGTSNVATVIDYDNNNRPFGVSFDIGAYEYTNSPTNDNCINAYNINVNTDFSCTLFTHGDIINATDSGVSDNGEGTPNDDVWFKFIATSTSHDFELLNISGTYTDLVHEIFSGNCTTLTSLNISNIDTSTVAGLIIGETYYVRVFGWSSIAGRDTSFDVCIKNTSLPPINDTCATATVLACGDLIIGETTIGATDNGDDLGCLLGEGVWYKFIGNDNNVTIDVTTVGYDVEVALGTTTNCTTFTNISCTDLITTTGTETITFAADFGNDYYLYIAHYENTSNTTGDFDLAVSCVPYPTCLDVSNITADNFSSIGNANLSWDIVIDATGYNWEIQPQGTAVGDGALIEGGSVITNYANTTMLTNGSDYTLYVQTDCGADGTANYQSYDFTFILPPVNDECAGAITLTEQNNIPNYISSTPYASSIQGATDSGLVAELCDGYTGNANDDVWFTFIASTQSPHITVEDDFDGVIVLYSGDCSNLVYISCKDSGVIPQIDTTGLIIGNTYLVRIFNYSATTTTTPNFNISIWSEGPGAIIDDFQQFGFKYQPNPVTNSLTITANEPITSFVIFNLLGQQIKQKHTLLGLKTVIDLSDLTNGAYVIKVTINKKTKSFKIIKN